MTVQFVAHGAKWWNKKKSERRVFHAHFLPRLTLIFNASFILWFSFSSSLYTRMPLQSQFLSIPVKIADTSCLVLSTLSNPHPGHLKSMKSCPFWFLFHSLSPSLLRRQVCLTVNSNTQQGVWKGQVSWKTNLNMNMCLNSRNWTFDAWIIPDWETRIERWRKRID